MKFLTDRLVAERYSVSRQTVWRWVREGKLPRPVKLTNRSTRWKLDDLLQFEAKQEVSTK